MPEQYTVQFINPILNGVQSVLSTMANIEVEPGKPYLNREGTAFGDITGCIEIEGYASGVISVSLSQSIVLSIVNNMLYEDYTEINEEIADAVGELTNMISGQARNALSESGMSFSAGTPRIIQGKGEKIGHIPDAPILSVPFSSPEGEMVVEISLAEAG